MHGPIKAGQRLEISAEAHPGGWLLRLSGVIDESFERRQIVDGRQGVVVLDLDGVRRITSFGVREWVTAMGELSAACFFVRCRPAIVSQFNMVANFAGRGQLVSLYAPYHCPRCSRDIEVLVDRRQRTGGALAMEVACSECHGPAEFDDIPETFFSYALTAPPPLLPPVAEAIIDGPPASFSTRLRVEKDVQGEVTVLWLSGPLDRTAHLKRVVEGLEGTVLVVLTGVRSVNEEGVSRLRQLTELPDARVFLVGVSPELARAFREAPEALGGARVVSVRLPIPCASCGRTIDVEADLAALSAMASSATGRPCPFCEGELGSPRVDQLRDTLRLPLVEAPPEVRQCSHRAPSEVTIEGTPTFAWAPASTTSSAATPASVRLAQAGASLVDPYPMPGRLRRYEILRRIATGGMGTVYLGRVVGAGGFERRVAIKIMHPHIAGEPAFIAMFLDEARLAARIHHPNVVATLDIDQTEEGLFIVMEYIEGLTVRQINHALRARAERLTPPVALRIVLDALAGLHAAHELADPEGKPLDIVHRDVSPPNLLVGVDGITRITDFGIARASSRLGESTKKGELKGKVGYMAPEQLRSQALDRRSDVYAVGVVLWELLTGQRAFRGDSDAAVLMAALEGITRAPGEVEPEIPQALSAACMGALAYEPQWRCPSAAAFMEELERAAREASLPIASAREVGAAVRDLAAVKSGGAR